ncbi:putative endonuclease [Clostridium acidisoli DSM 12555]|uniref:Putative endonuclease n=1 Tax=Clostridium acidisoli DSM 12555 TaxID=1121291 RepID=A0A1W1XRG0_9CLOT|nr:GIY-YIG nuclease family protein [Clostridium acidisoli]SMC26543.1 putative endonuclease [Clostridium acidisoli DSM 12555]
MNYVYILKCKDETLYTGYTNDLDNRIKVHNSGKGAKYTRCRLPIELIYFEKYETKSEAMKREYYIKTLKRVDKIKLIDGFNEHMNPCNE